MPPLALYLWYSAGPHLRYCHYRHKAVGFHDSLIPQQQHDEDKRVHSLSIQTQRCPHEGGSCLIARGRLRERSKSKQTHEGVRGTRLKDEKHLHPEPYEDVRTRAAAARSREGVCM